MNHLKRLLVPLLTVAIACLATPTYANAHPDHGGMTAPRADVAGPCTVDVTAAPGLLDVAPALEHASPADASHDVGMAVDAGVADDRRHPIVIDTPFVERARAVGSPPYALGLTTLTYSNLTITADGAVIVRPQRLNC